MRIVSLVPSITETLFDFGLSSAEVVGRTKFCIHPAGEVQQVAIVGGTKNIHIDKIAALQPDLIIANKEENERSQIMELMKTHRVWVTDVSTIAENKIFLSDLGTLLNQPDKAKEFTNSINTALSGYALKKPKTAYLIWQNPMMTVGNDTFIHDILRTLGFENIFRNRTRYPQIEEEDLTEAELILLSSEPYPFKEKHVGEMKQKFPHARIELVDGEAFSWFGSHLAGAGPYFEELRSRLLK